MSSICADFCFRRFSTWYFRILLNGICVISLFLRFLPSPIKALHLSGLIFLSVPTLRLYQLNFSYHCSEAIPHRQSYAMISNVLWFASILAVGMETVRYEICDFPLQWNLHTLFRLSNAKTFYYNLIFANFMHCKRSATLMILNFFPLELPIWCNRVHLAIVFSYFLSSWPLSSLFLKYSNEK